MMFDRCIVVTPLFDLMSSKKPLFVVSSNLPRVEVMLAQLVGGWVNDVDGLGGGVLG